MSQELYLVFFSIFFAITTTSVGSLHPFDTPSMCKFKYKKAWLRFIIANILLTLSPLIFFYFTFNWLENGNLNLHSTNTMIGFFYNILKLSLLVFLSMIGQGTYRIFYGLMLIPQKNKKNRYLFYDYNLYLSKRANGMPISLQDDLSTRPKTHRSPRKHIIPGAIWVILSCTIFLFK